MTDDRSRTCYYVLEGIASWVLRHENGGSKILSLRGPGTIVPLYYTYSSTAMEGTQEGIALSDMKLLCIPRQALRDLMLEVPHIAIAMCDAYVKYTTLLQYDVSSQVFDPANVRICSYLYIQYLSMGSAVNMTHEEIGEATGVTRATTSKVLSALAKDGIISTGRNRLTIIAVERLLEHCSYMTSPR